MMGNVYKINPQDECVEQASEWIAKLDRGLEQAEQQALMDWMASSQLNQDMLLKMAKMWDKMDVLVRLSDLFPQTNKQAPSKSRYGLAMAASMLLASLVGLGFWQSGIFEQQNWVAQQLVSENTYSTKIGEQSTFYLQDKTKVVLNTNSLVKVTYTDKQRVFELQRGEMHVTVAHNKQRPLSVYAAGQIIQAVGTAFNVQVINDKAELIVTDGKVLVAEQDLSRKNPRQLKSVFLPVNSLAVAKGEMVDLGNTKQKVVKLDVADMDANLSWQQGNLVFRGESLEQVMHEVSRYTAYDFVLADDAIKRLQVAGLFKTNDVNALLDALSRNFNIRHQRIASDKILLSFNQDGV
jgi:transmembrane sensor